MASLRWQHSNETRAATWKISTMGTKALRRMGCRSTRYVRASLQHRSHLPEDADQDIAALGRGGYQQEENPWSTHLTQRWTHRVGWKEEKDSKYAYVPYCFNGVLLIPGKLTGEILFLIVILNMSFAFKCSAASSSFLSSVWASGSVSPVAS